MSILLKHAYRQATDIGVRIRTLNLLVLTVQQPDRWRWATIVHLYKPCASFPVSGSAQVPQVHRPHLPDPGS